MPLSADDVRHLYRRIGFGALDADVAAFTGGERADVVDAVLSAPGAVDPQTVPSVAGMPRFLARQTLAEWWVAEMAHSPAPIHERITLFWHSHFACSSTKVTTVDHLRDQHIIFRTLGSGPFLNLIKAVTVSPATLIELDNAKNVSGREQENFARELMELYTVGIGNFSEADVVEMARSWTGHGLRSVGPDATYEFHPTHHDFGTKTVLGVTRDWNGPDTIDELVDGVGRVSTYRRLATKLWREFGDPEVIPAAAIDAISAAWSATGATTLDAMRALLMRNEFWAAERRYGMVKAPIPWMAELQRRTGQALSAMALDGRSGEMGQRLFDPPSVEGWGHNEEWVTPSRLLARAHVARLTRYEVRDAGFLDGMELLGDPEAADLVLNRFGVPDASDSTRSSLTSFLGSARAEMGSAMVAGETIRLAATLPEVNLA